MADEQVENPITIAFAHFDGEDEAAAHGALTRLLQEFGLARALAAGILELVPDSSLWRLTISGDMVQTVNELTERGEDNPYTTSRGAGHVGAITLPHDDGTFDIVISGHVLVETRDELGNIDLFVQHIVANAEHLSRHEAGHVALRIRGEDSEAFHDPQGLTPTDAVWRKHLGAHIDDHRIERYTAVHAPSPFRHADHLTDAITHLRGELNESKRAWRDDIDQALFRTMTAASGLIRVIAYLSAELGLDEHGRPRRPDPSPVGWDEYLEDSWDAWSLTLHRLRPVDKLMTVGELELILTSLCRLATTWLRSIGINYGITDDDREFIFWERDHY
ncbi:hypothetical protein [Microbacterium sp. C7(2022)]|uniref:hypothetical protein n=1 Tax=Microbacterium sp. C7(2022) TaxID=2992759 RepID=UPI00237A72FE|nr:hypothetical protein [Microbacterium sp. C7(2022)]MDE0545920.1 hypothetical protein [Microbacterium sp. C7(2022)]